MGRIGLAFRSFFGVLLNQQTASKVGAALAGETVNLPAPAAIETPAPAAPAPPKPKPAPTKPVRSDAFTLLETLQREARFLDFIQESLDAYDDAQVGAAVREVHRGTASVLQRLFSLQGVVDQPEGSQYEVTADTAAAQIRLVGNVSNQRPLTGELVHAGWRATKCDLPAWTGTTMHTHILAPAEVEVR